VIALVRDKKINRKIASCRRFVTETGKAPPQTGIRKLEPSGHQKAAAPLHPYKTEHIGTNWNTIKQLGLWKKKEQVVETTCESHEKTSKDNFYKIRGSRPLD
jgi:hypothetical protein